MDGASGLRPYGNKQDISAPPSPPAAINYRHLPSHSELHPLQPTQSEYSQNGAVDPATQCPYKDHVVSLPWRFRLSEDSIRSEETGQIICTISHLAKLSSWSLSGKSPIVITRADTNVVLGTIKIHTLSSNDIDLSIDGRETVIKTGGALPEHWSFISTIAPRGRFWWCIDGANLDGKGLKSFELTGRAHRLVLKDAKKHGRSIARMANDILTIERPGMIQALVDEVMVSAVGMAELARQARKDEKEALAVLKIIAGV